MIAELNKLIQELPQADTNLLYSTSESNFSSENVYSFNAKGLPSWANIDKKTGRIYGTPTTSDAGFSKATLSLTMNSLSVSKDILLTVNPTSSSIPSNAFGFYDHKFGDRDRDLRNDLTKELQGEYPAYSFQCAPNSKPFRTLPTAYHRFCQWL